MPKKDHRCTRCEKQVPTEIFRPRVRACVPCLQAAAAHARASKGTKKDLEPKDTNGKALESPVSLQKKVMELSTWHGMSQGQVSRKLGIPRRVVTQMLAKGKLENFDAEARELIRHELIVRLEDLHEYAKADGDWTEARRCLDEIAKVAGLVSTGGNTLNVGVSVSNNKIENAVDKWLERQEVLEGEVIS